VKSVFKLNNDFCVVILTARLMTRARAMCAVKSMRTAVSK